MNIICFSVNNWEARKARKQQFMESLSRHAHIEHVLYVEPPLNLCKLLIGGYPKEEKARILRALKGELTELSPKLLLYTPLFVFPFSFRSLIIYQLNMRLCAARIRAKAKQKGIMTYVLWLYHPYDHFLLRMLKDRTCSLFDWAEEWAVYFAKELTPTHCARIKKLEERMVRDTDIVFTVSQHLQEKASALSTHAYRIQDGTDPAVFQKPVYTEPPELRNAPRPILGYAGTIAERIDCNLLALVARANPHATIALVGSADTSRVNLTTLRAITNIRFIGMQPYSSLGDYMHAFDVCLLPYKPELSLSFPTKLFDYLASGKPIISTALVEISQFQKLIYVGATHEEFLQMVKEALKETDPRCARARIEAAENNSWQRRCEEIYALLQDKCHP